MKKWILVLLPLLLMLTACGDSEKPGPENNQKENSGQAGSGDSQKPGSDDPDHSQDAIPDDKPVAVEISHYITTYIYPSGFDAEYSRLAACFEIAPKWDRMIGYKSEGADLAEYESLCTKNGDTSYDKVRKIGLRNANDYACLAAGIVSIDLIADKAWGERPAGASWADLCWLVSSSPKTYIASGYTYNYDWNVVPRYFNQAMVSYLQESCPEKTPVSKPLVACTPEELSMMALSLDPGYFSCWLYLSDGPYPFESYKFTVIIKTSDGKTYEAPVKFT